MTDTKRKKFEADYWRENFETLLKTVKEKDKDNFDEVERFSIKAKKKVVGERTNGRLYRDLNNVTKKLNQNCWETFLKRVNDDKYELKRKRISISIDAYNYLQEMIEDFNFKDASEFIDFARGKISEKALKEFKRKRK